MYLLMRIQIASRYFLTMVYRDDGAVGLRPERVFTNTPDTLEGVTKHPGTGVCISLKALEV